MSVHDIIVVGTSAGGVEALQILVGGLPRDLPAAIFIVLHLPPTSPSFLDEILTQAGPPSRPLRKEIPVSKKLANETLIARGDHGLDAGILALGPLSPYYLSGISRGAGAAPGRRLHPLSLAYGPCIFDKLSPRGGDAIPGALSVEHAPHGGGEYTATPASGRPCP